MYTTSAKFSAAIKNNARYISAYFLYKGIKHNIRKLEIDDNIYTNDNFIGTFIAKNGTISVNVGDVLPLEDEEIDVFMGLKVNDAVEYVPMGTYRVYAPESNIKFKIMDYRYKFNIKFDTLKVVYPSSPIKILQEACAQAGVALATTSLINGDLIIPSEVFFGYEASCADVVLAVAQASCSFAKITRDNKLALKWFSKVDFDIDYNHQNKRAINNEYGVINSVVLAREPQNDNIYWPQEISTERVEIKIVNNPLLDVDRHSAVITLYNKLNGFRYTPFTTTSQGYFHLDSGDIVRLQQKEGTYLEVLLMNHSISYSGGVTSTFGTAALTKTQINYKKASAIENKLLNTELAVDKVVGEISAKIEKTEKTVEKLDNGVEILTKQVENVEQQITSEQIINTVSTAYYKKDESDDLFTTKEELSSEIKQVKDSVTITLKEMSGFNFIYNSSGWNSTNFWYGTKNEDGSTTPVIGAIEGLKTNDTTDNTISGSAFKFISGTMRQDVRLSPGNKYTLSCKTKKYMSACSFKIYQGDISTILFQHDALYTDEAWHECSATFTCLSSLVTLEIISSAEYLIIADIMLNDGEISKTWTSNNDEIYAGNVKIDKDGIRIAQTDTETETIIDSSEFAVEYKGKKVVRVNKDTTVLQKVVAEDDLQIGQVKLITRPNGLDFAVIE
ncbi:MAG: hypothetical protein RR646_02565 [Erysipelotrichaceae bacterium]|uniref:hypothetical protein n=1 Tax=Niameybacter sp. TaxID=2033640 RepID=UPI002FC81A63